MMKLIKCIQINAEGTSIETEKVVYAEHSFDKPTDIFVILSLATFHLNSSSDAAAMQINVDSVKTMQGDEEVLTTNPEKNYSVWNALEFKQCTWIKFRLNYMNGHASGTASIYMTNETKKAGKKLRIE